jgi:hypothetical protein
MITGLNIAHTTGFQFENRENLRNTAKDVLSRQGASEEFAKKFVDDAIFSQIKNKVDYNPQLAIIKASTQISVNESLKETLKYLKSQANKKTLKTPVLGELWNMLDKEELNYAGELVDFVVDNTLENIFAA